MNQNKVSNFFGDLHLSVNNTKGFSVHQSIFIKIYKSLVLFKNRDQKKSTKFRIKLMSYRLQKLYY